MTKHAIAPCILRIDCFEHIIHAQLVCIVLLVSFPQLTYYPNLPSVIYLIKPLSPPCSYLPPPLPLLQSQLFTAPNAASALPLPLGSIDTMISHVPVVLALRHTLCPVSQLHCTTVSHYARAQHSLAAVSWTLLSLAMPSFCVLLAELASLLDHQCLADSGLLYRLCIGTQQHVVNRQHGLHKM